MEINLNASRSIFNSVKDGERQTNKSHSSIIRACICLQAWSTLLYLNLNNAFSQSGVLCGGKAFGWRSLNASLEDMFIHFSFFLMFHKVAYLMELDSLAKTNVCTAHWSLSGISLSISVGNADSSLGAVCASFNGQIHQSRSCLTAHLG